MTSGDGPDPDELDRKIAAYIEARARRDAQRRPVNSRQLMVVVMVAAIVSSLLLSGSLASSAGTGIGLTVMLAVTAAVLLGWWILRRGPRRGHR